MESVSLNSPIPIPLQTVKIREVFIPLAFAESRIASVPQAEGSRQETAAVGTTAAMLSFIHSTNTARPARAQGPWQGWGCSGYRRRHGCPRGTCFLLLILPTWARVQLLLRTPASSPWQYALRSVCPPACPYYPSTPPLA